MLQPGITGQCSKGREKERKRERERERERERGVCLQEWWRELKRERGKRRRRGGKGNRMKYFC